MAKNARTEADSVTNLPGVSGAMEEVMSCEYTQGVPKPEDGQFNNSFLSEGQQ